MDDSNQSTNFGVDALEASRVRRAASYAGEFVILWATLTLVLVLLLVGMFEPA